jgi:hypothetical protein
MPPKKATIDNGEIINFYEVIPKKYLDKVSNPNEHLHNIKLPFRMCVVAPSGTGKTNFLLNLIKVFSSGQGTFADITIITRNKAEPLYEYLEGEFEQIKIKEGMSNTPKLDDMDKEYNHLVVWDDLVLSKNLESVCDYFLRARKRNVSVVFLSQSFYDIPKFIRKNSSYLVLLDLGGSKREQTAIMNEWSSDLDADELRAVYNDAVSVPLRPLIITGGKVKKNEKYRKGFLEYYNLDTFLLDIPRTDSKGKRKVVKGKGISKVDDEATSSDEDL